MINKWNSSRDTTRMAWLSSSQDRGPARPCRRMSPVSSDQNRQKFALLKPLTWVSGQDIFKLIFPPNLNFISSRGILRVSGYNGKTAAFQFR